MGEICSARSSILPGWFADDIGIAYFRYLAFEGTHVLLIGNKVNIFLWADVFKAVVGPLYQ